MSTRPHPRPSCETAAKLLAGRRGTGATHNLHGGPMRPFDIRLREVMDHQCRMLPAERAAEFVALEQDRDRWRDIARQVLSPDTTPPAASPTPSPSEAAQ